MTSITQIIRGRRSIFPKSYIDKPIAKDVIEEMLINAHWAPNHKKTEPWRFKVYHGESLDVLSRTLPEVYKNNVPEERFNERTYAKFGQFPSAAGCVIAICMQRDQKESLPEWEEIAAVGGAVQNMQLTCAAHNIGCYWASPGILINNAKQFMPLAEGERCLGFLYMGYYEDPQIPGSRQPIEGRVQWM